MTLAMTDFASLLQPDRGQSARTIHLVDKDSFEGWAKARPAADRALIEAQRFDGKTGYASVLLPSGGDLEVVAAVAGGLLSVDEACKRYSLSLEEFTSWQRAVDRSGMPGLRVTRIKQYRDQYERQQRY